MKTYQAKYNPITNKGVYGISLVENPAMEGTFVALSKAEKTIELKTVNEEQRILLGLVLEPNKLIYRYDEQTQEEYNITFDEQTIKDLSYGFFKNNSQSNSTIEHDNNPIKGVTFTESWIVENPTNDKSNNFGFSYPKGSWVAVMKVDSDEVWNNYVKTGKVLGFSIDAVLSLEEVNLKSNMNKEDDFRVKMIEHHKMAIEMVNEYKPFLKNPELVKIADNILKSQGDEISIMENVKLNINTKMNKEILEEQKNTSSLLEKILLAFTPKEKEIEVKLGSVKIADGSVTIEFEGDTLQKDIACWVIAEDGTKVPVPVSEYVLEDGSTLVVTQEGIVGDVKAVEAAPATDAQAAPQAMADEAQQDANIAKEIESAIKSIMIKYEAQEKQIIELKAELVELGKQPASKPINSKPATVELNKGKFSDLLNKINNN